MTITFLTTFRYGNGQKFDYVLKEEHYILILSDQ